MPWRFAVARALAWEIAHRDAFLHAEIHHEPCSWDPWLGRGRWRLAEPCGGAKAWLRRGRSTQTSPQGARGGPGLKQPLQDGGNNKVPSALRWRQGCTLFKGLLSTPVSLQGLACCSQQIWLPRAQDARSLLREVT